LWVPTVTYRCLARPVYIEITLHLYRIIKLHFSVSPSGYGPGFVLVLITYPDSTLLRAELYFTMSVSTTWLPKVPVLTQENYNLWKVEVKMLLIREKLWAVVSGRDEKPSTEGSAASTKKALMEWEEKTERAYANAAFGDDARLLVLEATSVARSLERRGAAFSSGL
jgi:hypothetical protein